MNGSTAQKVVAIICFVLVGLPTGLCSVAATPFVIGMFVAAANESADALTLGLFYTILWLTGLGIAYLLIRWIIIAFRGPPNVSNNGRPGAPP